MANCDRCEGTGLVHLMPDGHEVECPACEGIGYDDAVTVRNVDDELGQILGEALRMNEV